MICTKSPCRTLIRGLQNLDAPCKGVKARAACFLGRGRRPDAPWISARRKKVLIWSVRYRHLCERIRGLQNLYAPCKGVRVVTFCFCKKNQKAAGTPSCDLGSNRRSIRYCGWDDRLLSGNLLCANHYFAQYRRQ